MALSLEELLPRLNTLHQEKCEIEERLNFLKEEMTDIRDMLAEREERAVQAKKALAAVVDEIDVSLDQARVDPLTCAD